MNATFFPVAPLLNYLARRLTPGVETVRDAVYVRTTAQGALKVAFATDTGTLEFPERPPTRDEELRLARLFRHHEDWSTPELFTADPLLGPLTRAVPGLRPLGCWEPFELCLRTVVGQQVSVAAAGTLM